MDTPPAERTAMLEKRGAPKRPQQKYMEKICNCTGLEDREKYETIQIHPEAAEKDSMELSADSVSTMENQDRL